MDATVRAAALTGLLLTSAVFAQSLPPANWPEPENLKLTRPVPPLGGDATPRLDPSVQPSQLLQPVAPPSGVQATIPDSPRAALPPGVVTTPATTPALPAEPPPPTVRVQVLTPAHIAPGKPIPYRVIVTNSSPATAYKVKVRIPSADGAAGLNKVEPKPDGLTGEFKPPVQMPAEMTWSFKSLGRGEQKVIELELAPPKDVKDVRLRAYVSFEHGQEVTTQIEKPKLVVKKTASKEVARGEPVTVQVTVTNTGQVPIGKVKLVEVATGGFEFRAADAVPQQKTNERMWELGTLARGQSKIVTYQLLGGKPTGGELLTTSNASSDDGTVAEIAESKTRILVPDLGFALTGPASVESRKPAIYEAEVRNNGTLPLSNVVVSIPIPDDCQPTKVTKDAQRYADRASWTLAKLAPGEAHKFRLTVTANSSGKRVVRATAKDKSGAVNSEKAVETLFLGRAELHWNPELPAILAVGKQATLRITVKNNGEDSDAGVSPRILIPDGLKIIEATPKQMQQFQDGTVVFNAVEIKPGQSQTFAVLVERVQPGQKRVILRLDARSLGDRPITKDHAIE